MSVNVPAFADIEAAAARIAPFAFKTPLVENADLNAKLGARVLLKLETLQRTGSFKFRGALGRICKILPAERAKGVVAFSSGNHAQGVAAAAALFDVPALIVMPRDAPRAHKCKPPCMMFEWLGCDSECRTQGCEVLQKITTEEVLNAVKERTRP